MGRQFAKEKDVATEKILDWSAAGYGPADIKRLLLQPPYNKNITVSTIRGYIEKYAEEIATKKLELVQEAPQWDPVVRIKTLNDIIVKSSIDGVEVLTPGGASYAKFDFPAGIAAIKEMNAMQGYAKNAQAEEKVAVAREETTLIKQAFEAYQKSKKHIDPQSVIIQFRKDMGIGTTEQITDAQLLSMIGSEASQ